MARIVRFSTTGGPEVLKIDTVETPLPGPGEVRVSVKAIGLNRSESMWRNGEYIETPRFPARIGYEASGLIESIGEGVEGLKVGDAISIVPGFSQHDYGTYGDLVLMPAALAVKYPSHLTYIEAATIWMMFITAYGALVETAGLYKGDVVLIPGASSGVGLAAIQIVNAAGGVSVALTRTSAKVQQLKDAGAAHVIVTQEQDIASEVSRITNGKGADIAFDPVAGPTLNTLLESLAKKGKFVLYGALSTETTELSVLTMLIKQLSIESYVIFDTTQNPLRLKAATEFVLDGFERGVFTPMVDEKVFPFEYIVEAHEYLEANEQFGKIVVEVAR
jgi:NADPH:quinone reductase-like Zn-dependent oxidoreductase